MLNAGVSEGRVGAIAGKVGSAGFVGQKLATRLLVKKKVGGGGPPDGSSAKSLHKRIE